MLIDSFLKNRTRFIRYFYNHAVSPFKDIIIAIEKREEPYVPTYTEDPEPPFLEEWIEANTGIETVGHTCMSMLASSLQLFLKAWVHRLEKDHGITLEVNWTKGWFGGYRQIFELIKLPMDDCPADIEIIEQVILARNRIQHPEEITTLDVRHSMNDLKKYPRPFFAHEHEIKLAGADEEGAISWWRTPSVVSTKDKIFEAIAQVESLCLWLESKYWKT